MITYKIIDVDEIVKMITFRESVDHVYCLDVNKFNLEANSLNSIKVGTLSDAIKNPECYIFFRLSKPTEGNMDVKKNILISTTDGICSDVFIK